MNTLLFLFLSVKQGLKIKTKKKTIINRNLINLISPIDKLKEF